MKAGPVTNKIIELCETIATDERFLKYRADIINFLENKDNYPEYFDLLNYQEELENKKHGGDDISMEESETLAALGAKAFANRDVVAFMEAQDALEQVQDLVNNAMHFVMDNGRAPSAEEIKEAEYDN